MQRAPGLPCALCFREGANQDAKLGRSASRDREAISNRHCLRQTRSVCEGSECDEQSIYPRVFSAQKLAAAAGLSERYVNELLYEAGASCTTRLLELRLRKAADLLAHSGERRISDIAFGCGFNDLSYFNRCFRRRFGQTPTAARGVACSAGRRFVIRIRTKLPSDILTQLAPRIRVTM